MTATDEPGFAIRRVVAAFGASTASRPALESTVEVAARLGAELEALFVEDVGLLHLADLPFVREASLHAERARPIERDALERQLRALGAQVQRNLAEAALRRQIRLSFRTARGRLLAEVARAAAGADLLILQSISRPLARELRLELTAREQVVGTARSVLLLQPERAPSGPVHVILDDPATAPRALRAALELARRYPSPLFVTTSRDDAELERHIEAAAVDAVAGVSIERRPRPTTGTDPLRSLCAAVGGGTLVLDVSSPLIGSAAAWEHLAKAPCTVLLVH